MFKPTDFCSWDYINSALHTQYMWQLGVGGGGSGLAERNQKYIKGSWVTYQRLLYQSDICVGFRCGKIQKWC